MFCIMLAGVQPRSAMPTALFETRSGYRGGGLSQSRGYRERIHDRCACVERSKADRGSNIRNAVESESVRGTGSGPTEGMPVLSAARQTESKSGLGASTKGAALRTYVKKSVVTFSSSFGRSCQ